MIDPVLADLRRRLSRKLERVAEELPKAYRLTLVARHSTRNGAGVLLTDDDLDLAVAEIQKLKERPEVKEEPK